MYLSVLGREPDPEGFSYWTSQPVENLRQLFYQASIPETEKRVGEIPVTTAIPKPVIGQRSEPTAQELYLGLGRAPDPAGLAFWEITLSLIGRPPLQQGQPKRGSSTTQQSP
jgi:hypothetical protein